MRASLIRGGTRVEDKFAVEREAHALQAGIFVNLEPLVGAILGVFLLHETLGIMAVVGGVLIIGGAVYFSQVPAQN
jgi:drug/metabolite transporter (DMT)-like permease